jgi:4a-hydroxytetrahydrobiopterin dehydratase
VSIHIYTTEQIAEKLTAFPGWSPGEDGQLHKEFVFKNFAQAMLFAAAVGHLAEAADHHPDLFIHGYRHVAISLMTHSEGSITQKDFDLIARIEALPQRG